jgi:hypothetical protein
MEGDFIISSLLKTELRTHEVIRLSGSVFWLLVTRTEIHSRPVYPQNWRTAYTSEAEKVIIFMKRKNKKEELQL